MAEWAPTTAAIAEVVFFLFTAVIAVVGLRRSALETRQKRLLIGAMGFSVVAKIGLAAVGHNPDVDSYRIVSDIVAQGRSVYANTDRYNYGPVWAWLVSGFGRIAGAAAGEGFHLWTAAFLAAVDVVMGLAIARAYSWIAALVYLLSPIGLLISGFHSQFDNLAVLLALLAWLLVRDGKPKPAVLIASSVATGLSLVVKHILFLFPVWLVFYKPLGKLRYRVLYAGIAYGLFAASFLPWWGDPASRAGIVKNVFGYNSTYGNSWLVTAIGLFLPARSLDAFLTWPPAVSGFKALWMVFMIAVGAALARKGVRELYLFYLMALYASSPALTGQYAAIPMLAAAVFCAAWESWAFLAAGTLANLASRYGVVFLWLRTIAPLVIAGRPHSVAEMMHGYAHPFFMVASQFCAAALLVRQWRHMTRPALAGSPRLQIGRAAALVAVGGLPVALGWVRRTAAHFMGVMAP